MKLSTQYRRKLDSLMRRLDSLADPFLNAAEDYHLTLLRCISPDNASQGDKDLIDDLQEQYE